MTWKQWRSTWTGFQAPPPSGREEGRKRESTGKGRPGVHGAQGGDSGSPGGPQLGPLGGGK